MGGNMLEKLTRWCYQQRRKVLGLWVLAFLGFVILGQVAGGPFSTNFNTPGSDSKAALQLLQKRFPARSGDTITVVFKADNGINAPGVKAKVDALLADLATKQHVVGTVSPYTPEGASGVSRDGKIAYGELQLDVQGNDVPVPVAKTMIAAAKAANGDGVRFELGGGAIQGAEFVQGGGTEGLGILAAMVILLVSFGSLLAMGLPILSAIMGIGIGLAILEVLTHVIEVPNFSPIVAAMIGIGVGSPPPLGGALPRFRGAAPSPPPAGAWAGSGGGPAAPLSGAPGSRGRPPPGQPRGAPPGPPTPTAGKAVLFAGTTVIISVLG